jgi:hypothetical protein
VPSASSIRATVDEAVFLQEGAKTFDGEHFAAECEGDLAMAVGIWTQAAKSSNEKDLPCRREQVVVLFVYHFRLLICPPPQIDIRSNPDRC